MLFIAGADEWPAIRHEHIVVAGQRIGEIQAGEDTREFLSTGNRQNGIIAKREDVVAQRVLASEMLMVRLTGTIRADVVFNDDMRRAFVRIDAPPAIVAARAYLAGFQGDRRRPCLRGLPFQDHG